MGNGIIGISNALAEKVMTAQEVAGLSGFTEKYIIQKLGFKTKRISSSDQHPSDFAVKAAQAVLNKTKINPTKIDFIIYCSSGIFDYQFWSPASHIQNLIGAKNAFTFEANNGCNSSALGILLADSLIKSHGWKYGLIVVSDTLSKFIDYSDSKLFPLFSFSDGASAMIFGNDHPSNNILSHSFHSDGEYSGCNKLTVGGTRFTTIKNIKSHDIFFKLEDQGKINKLRENVICDSYIKVIQNSLANAGIKPPDLSMVFTNQNTRKIIDSVFATLGIPKKKSYNTMEEYGHLAGIDTLVALHDCLEKNLLKKGDLVLMATAGIGFNWGAQVIQI